MQRKRGDGVTHLESVLYITPFKSHCCCVILPGEYRRGKICLKRVIIFFKGKNMLGWRRRSHMVWEYTALFITEMIIEQKLAVHFLHTHIFTHTQTQTQTHASCPLPPALVIMTYISCVTVSVWPLTVVTVSAVRTPPSPIQSSSTDTCVCVCVCMYVCVHKLEDPIKYSAQIGQTFLWWSISLPEVRALLWEIMFE